MARLRVNYSKHARFCSSATITQISIYQPDWYSYYCTIFDSYGESDVVMNITSSIVAFIIIVAIIVGIINFLDNSKMNFFKFKSF